MGPLLVVEPEPVANARSGLRYQPVVPQVNLFVLQRTPQPFNEVMPTPGLCRARVGRVLRLRRISASRYSRSRHNQRLSKNASRESGGWKRSGTAFDAAACASAFSLSCISA